MFLYVYMLAYACLFMRKYISSRTYMYLFKHIHPPLFSSILYAYTFAFKPSPTTFPSILHMCSYVYIFVYIRTPPPHPLPTPAPNPFIRLTQSRIWLFFLPPLLLWSFLFTLLLNSTSSFIRFGCRRSRIIHFLYSPSLCVDLPVWMSCSRGWFTCNYFDNYFVHSPCNMNVEKLIMCVHWSNCTYIYREMDW